MAAKESKDCKREVSQSLHICFKVFSVGWRIIAGKEMWLKKKPDTTSTLSTL